MPATPAAYTQPSPQTVVLSGAWTASGLGNIAPGLDTLQWAAGTAVVIDGAAISAFDTAGAWLVQRLLQSTHKGDVTCQVVHLEERFARLLEAISRLSAEQAAHPAPPVQPTLSALQQVGRSAVSAAEEAASLLSFVGEVTVSLARSLAHPKRLRWRPVLFNIRTAGFDALPIVGLLAFLLGVVVAYQGASQLRQYGANIFVADLVGVSMLREFAPLITAIIVAGRSGSSYAAQIGTMAVTEEIDAMRTLGINPQEMLVLPKVIALMIALPLLTVFADGLGVFGGMVMARQQLAVSYTDFLDRLVKAVVTSTMLTGIGKTPVFAFIIAMVGCHQGFRTRGGADSVGRQTTRSVVQAIFFVIVADGLFSIVFSALDL